DGGHGVSECLENVDLSQFERWFVNRTGWRAAAGRPYPSTRFRGLVRRIAGGQLARGPLASATDQRCGAGVANGVCRMPERRLKHAGLAVVVDKGLWFALAGDFRSCRGEDGDGLFPLLFEIQFI